MIPMATSRCDLAREDHTPDAIRARLNAKPVHSYLRDFTYGAIDGAVTTFAVVAGVAGAGLAPAIVIILGVANLIADGFSMAASNFLGARAEEQVRDRARRAEEAHVEHWPEGEREEIRQIFAAKGFEGADLVRVVAVITSDRQRWVDTMLKEELGLPLQTASPTRAALTTFVAFVSVGTMPLVGFLYRAAMPRSTIDPFLCGIILTAAALFMVGAVKSRFVDQRWAWAGLETLTVGGSAALLAYMVGVALKGLGA